MNRYSAATSFLLALTVRHVAFKVLSSTCAGDCHQGNDAAGCPRETGDVNYSWDRQLTRKSGLADGSQFTFNSLQGPPEAARLPVSSGTQDTLTALVGVSATGKSAAVPP